jgi:group II intron reverse transcriptase/maturase
MAKEQPSKEGQSQPLIKVGRTGIVKFTNAKGCVMQEAEAYLELVHERGKKGLPIERVYRQLFNPSLYLKAYGKIYRNAGAMTQGVTEETVDGMSMEKIETIIEAMRYEKYQWTPSKRVYIPKKNGKKRPLGIPPWSDKLVQEVLRTVLEAYYEPQFSEHSHGFRPERGCHTALREIYYDWKGVNWFIEGDISACFDRLDHELILKTLEEKVHDGRIIQLVKNMLDAGYMEDWKLNETLSGTPQGGVISPLLANILLDKLDKFVGENLIPKYTRGKLRGDEKSYTRLANQAKKARAKGNTEKANALKKQYQKMPSKDPNDPNYRRLKYVRYADDFLLGFSGPKEEAEEIKQAIKEFLQEQLKLELSEAKTLITNAKSEKARFLGYEIHIAQEDGVRVWEERNGRPINRRRINGTVIFEIPMEVKIAYTKRYMKNGKPTHRAELVKDSEYDIVTRYQLEYRGIANYYKLAKNLHTLNHLKWVMQISLTKTLAHKLKISVTKVYEKYRAKMTVENQTYEGLQIAVPREGKEPLIATWGGIPLKWDIKATLEDKPKKLPYGRTELVKRLLAEKCEHCGTTTDPLEVHHIRKLSDLKQYDGREKPAWVQFMSKRKRKTMVLCRPCHLDVTHGRPMTRQKSST